MIRGGVAKGDPGRSVSPRPDPWKTFENADLAELIDEGDDRTDFLLRFTLAHPNMNTTIVGTLNPDHLAQNVVAASKRPLPTDVYEEAKKRLERVGEVPAAD